MSGLADNSQDRVGEAFDFGEARCPRCGYDQRGVMAQWSASCPLMGRCAECGLEYRWAELLVPEKFEPMWCVEFARGFGRMVRSCFGTTRRALWPWVFWKRLTMSHEVRWRRIAVYWMFLFAVLLLCFVVQQTAVAVRMRMLVLQSAKQYTVYSQQSLARAQQDLKALEAMTFENDPPDDGPDEPPGTYWGPSILNAQDRDRQLAAMRPWLQQLQALQGQPAVVQQPLWRAIYEAVCTPWRASSRGLMVFPGGGTQPYPSPRRLHATVMAGGWVGMGVGGGASRVQVVWGGALALTIVLMVLMPVEFVLLPMSRRRAKVRWRHVLRVGVYSVTIPAVVTSAALLLVLAVVLLPSVQGFLLGGLRWLALVLPASVVVWWAVAIGRYLKIPRGWLIAILFAVIAFGVTVMTTFWINQWLNPYPY